MKFPRNARVFRGQLDTAPFASVFFLLLVFALLGSLVYTPGVRIPVQLPTANNLPGVEGPTVAVAVDASGRFYFENQLVSEDTLFNRLKAIAGKSPQPLTLVVQADKAVTTETLLRLENLARGTGIQQLLLATLPGIFDDAPAATPPSGIP